MQGAIDRLIDTVRAQLLVTDEAAAHVGADLRESIQPDATPEEIDRLTQRLKRGPRLAWMFALLGLMAVFAAGFGSMKTFGWFDSDNHRDRLLKPLQGTDRLKMAAWLAPQGVDASARAWLAVEPENLVARELFLISAPQALYIQSELRRFVAESERLDPENGIHQLRFLLWLERVALISSRSPEATKSAVEQIGLKERIESRIDGFQEDLYALAQQPHDHRGASDRALLFFARQDTPNVYVAFRALIRSLRKSAQSELDRADLRTQLQMDELAKAAEADYSFLPELARPILEDHGYHARAILGPAGLNPALVEPLHQMHWASMDRRIALFAAWGVIGVLVLACFVPLLRGKVVHEAGNSLQWIMPVRDPCIAAGGALILTLAAAVAFLRFGPRPRALAPATEPDLYYYAPLAALFLLLAFTFTAAFHARRGRPFGWRGRAGIWALLAVPIALFSLWAQFAWQGQPRLMQANLSCAGLFGLLVMTGLLFHVLGDPPRSLERTVLIKQFVKTLVVASLLMSATAGACYLHELHWGRQDRLLGDHHGRPEIFRLRDAVSLQSRLHQQEALDLLNR